jgi:hypothetical protein
MQSFSQPRISSALVLLFLSACLATSAGAQNLLSLASSPISGDSTCFASGVASVTSRPTVTNATDTTQCGVVEMEYGLERQWPGAGANHDDLTGGLRFGLTPKLDFH